MTYPLIQRELTVHLNNGNWYARPLEETRVLGPADYGWYRYNMYPDSFTFGEGLLAGSSIPGSRRLIFGAWSPQWEGFYLSSMGGAAYTFHGVGVNYVALRGYAAQPSVLLLNHSNGEIQVRIEPINVEPLWNAYADPNGERLIGYYALQQAVYDRYNSEYQSNKVRIFGVGPAAMHTREGAIGSSPIRKGVISPVIEWAGRGGLGSRLLQSHNIAACIFGGGWEDPDLRDSAEIDAYFMEHFGKRTIQADLAMTEKYRYVAEFETGGTFGVNMRELNERILSFNYTSIYHTPEERLQQHDEFILKHYLKQFNEETMATKSFQQCGEPCPVVCKKMRDKFKKDYEPYQVMGPLTGIFDQRAAEELNDFADAMGFDAIQCGANLAWIMECVADGLIDPLEYGFPPASELRFGFTADPQTFDVVADSARNSAYGIAVLTAILFDPRAAVFRQGMRLAAYDIDKKNGTHTRDRAVYLAHGEGGYMSPNQYWVPGMFSPMPMMGKYFVYYGAEFMAPYALGRKNVERMTYELFNENTGICRFHRKWSEVITDDILYAHYGLDLNYKNHQFALARSIHERESLKVLPWETERTIDMMFKFLEEWERLGLKDPQLAEWLVRFRTDKYAAARAFWQDIRRGISSAFEDGPESIPEIYSQGQKQKMAVVQPPA